MPFSVRISSVIPARPCAFCLGLQNDSVFADFDLDEDGRVFLQRISFDGYGCYGGDYEKMSPEDSRILIASVERSAIESPQIEILLRTYFRQNAGGIWNDALATHGLL